MYNNDVVSLSGSNTNTGEELSESISASVVLNLRKGDAIWIHIWGSVYGNNVNRYTNFMGVLIK